MVNKPTKSLKTHLSLVLKLLPGGLLLLGHGGLTSNSELPLAPLRPPQPRGGEAPPASELRRQKSASERGSP